jgi:hypothetical protein
MAKERICASGCVRLKEQASRQLVPKALTFIEDQRSSAKGSRKRRAQHPPHTSLSRSMPAAEPVRVLVEELKAA